MILQSLARYYEILADDPETDIAPQDFSVENVSFALEISEAGDLCNILALFEQVPSRRGIKEVARHMLLPERVGRSGLKIAPNFLWDNCAYVLGISTRDADDPAYSRDRFEAFRDFNMKMLDSVESPSSRAVSRFMANYDPSVGRQHPVIASRLEDILKSTGNLVFMVNGRFVHDSPDLQRVWSQHKSAEVGAVAQCLISGDYAPIARVHPRIKGVAGTNSNQGTIVAFNERAYESFNRERQQGMNAPVSEQATFAYTTALNYLLSRDNENPSITLGDTTVVYWAESDNKAYRDVFMGLFDPTFIEVADDPTPGRNRPAQRRLGAVAGKVKRGEPLDVDSLMEDLDPTTRFYVLGLAPNVTRISVRFFHVDLFANFIERIMHHYGDLSMIKEFDNQKTYLTVRDVVDETISKKASNPTASPLLAGAIFRAILTSAPYPAGLYNAILNRIRADQDDRQKHVSKIGYERAAIIKAYLLRKYRNQPGHPIQEVLQMSLNEGSRHPAYVLGRLFAVLEKVQQEAIPNLNATIKDRYFTTACASPASVFPVLLRLSQHHISKAEYGYASDRRIQEILDLLDVETNPIPTRLTLDGQGVFVLGYYHQRAAFYRKRAADDVDAADGDQPTDN